jgi:succinoglycan biosynthesis protein ExoA
MIAETQRRVVVVVPTLDEAPMIESVLHALTEDLPPRADVRFVVDGGSTDGTTTIVKRLTTTMPALSLLHNPRRFQSAAVNLAADVLGQRADVLVRCDAHQGYPRGYVRMLLETMDRTGADSVVVPMDSVGSNCLQKAIAWVSNSPVGTGGSAHRGGRRSGFVDHGHHAAFRMRSFRRTGGYNETFTHNEDAEFDCRQRAYGHRIYLDADIRLRYTPRATLRSLARQYFHYGRGRSRTVRLHPHSLRLRQLVPPAVVGLCVLSLVLAPTWPWMLVWPGLYAAGLTTTSLYLVVRHRAACGLLGGLAAATMHGAWAAGFFAGWLHRRERPWHQAVPEATAQDGG